MPVGDDASADARSAPTTAAPAVVNSGAYTPGPTASPSLIRFVRVFAPLASPTPEGRRLRESAYKRADTNHSGSCSLSELNTYIRSELGASYGGSRARVLFDEFRPVYLNAFRSAAALDGDGDDSAVRPSEFRLLHSYLTVYAAMVDAFVIIGITGAEERNEDASIRRRHSQWQLTDFLAGYRKVRGHGFVELLILTDDELATDAFARMDLGNTGSVTLSSFCDHLKQAEISGETALGKLFRFPKRSPRKPWIKFPRLGSPRGYDDFSVSSWGSEGSSWSAMSHKSSRSHKSSKSRLFESEDLANFTTAFEPFVEGDSPPPTLWNASEPERFASSVLRNVHGKGEGDRLLALFLPAIVRAGTNACLPDEDMVEESEGNQTQKLAKRIVAAAGMLEALRRLDGGLSSSLGSGEGADVTIQLSEWIYGYVPLIGFGFVGLPKNDVEATMAFDVMRGNADDVNFERWCNYLERREVQEGTELGALLRVVDENDDSMSSGENDDADGAASAQVSDVQSSDSDLFDPLVPQDEVVEHEGKSVAAPMTPLAERVSSLKPRAERDDTKVESGLPDRMLDLQQEEKDDGGSLAVQEKAKVKSALQNTREELDTALAGFDEAHAKMVVEGLHSELRKSESAVLEVDSLRAEVASLRKALDDSETARKEAAAAAEEASCSLRTELDTMQKTLETTTRNNDATREEEVKKEVASLRAEVSKSNIELEDANDKHRNMNEGLILAHRQEMDNLRLSLRAEAAREQDNALQELRSELNDVHHREMKASGVLINEARLSTESQASSLQEEVAKLTAALEDANNKNSFMKKELEKESDRRQGVARQQEDALDQLADAHRREVDGLQCKLNEMNRENASLLLMSSVDKQAATERLDKENVMTRPQDQLRSVRGELNEFKLRKGSAIVPQNMEGGTLAAAEQTGGEVKKSEGTLRVARELHLAEGGVETDVWQNNVTNDHDREANVIIENADDGTPAEDYDVVDSANIDAFGPMEMHDQRQIQNLDSNKDVGTEARSVETPPQRKSRNLNQDLAEAESSHQMKRCRSWRELLLLLLPILLLFVLCLLHNQCLKHDDGKQSRMSRMALSMLHTSSASISAALGAFGCISKDTHENEVMGLQQDLANCRVEATDAKPKGRAHLSKIQDLEKMISLSESKLQDADQSINKLRTKVNGLATRETSHLSKIRTLEKSYAECQSKLKDTQQSLSKMEADSHSNISNTSETDGSLKQIQTEASACGLRLAMEKEAVSKMERQRNNAEEARDAAMAEARASDMARANAEAEVQAAHNARAKAQEEARAAQKAKIKAEEEAQSARDARAKAEEEVAGAHKAKAIAKEDAQSANEARIKFEDQAKREVKLAAEAQAACEKNRLEADAKAEAAVAKARADAAEARVAIEEAMSEMEAKAAAEKAQLEAEAQAASEKARLQAEAHAAAEKARLETQAAIDKARMEAGAQAVATGATAQVDSHAATVPRRLQTMVASAVAGAMAVLLSQVLLSLLGAAGPIAATGGAADKVAMIRTVGMQASSKAFSFLFPLSLLVGGPWWQLLKRKVVKGLELLDLLKESNDF